MSHLLKKMNVSLICSFFMRALSNSLTVAICHEQPEQFTHGRSFVMRDLSNSLTVAHLSSVIWANCTQLLIKISNFEQMSKWAMSRWANSKPWNLEVQIQNLNPHAARYIKEQPKQKMWNLNLKNYFFTLQKACFWLLKKKPPTNVFFHVMALLSFKNNKRTHFLSGGIFEKAQIKLLTAKNQE